MRNFKFYLSFIALFAFLFTSCSKDEDVVLNDSEKATLSFGAIVQDLANKSTAKQSDPNGLPACSDDAVAGYVSIILERDGVAVVGEEGDPLEVELVDGKIYTEEVPELELTAGTYVLTHFAVYTDTGDLLWIAPKGGAMAEYVDAALPMTINLGSGVKKYVDVSVICYDDRDINQYGYLFFELDTNRAFEYCFFANYCGPDGRHYPARYSVDISIDGEVIYEDVINTTDVNDYEDPFAEALCFALPDLAAYADDEEYIDYTLTLLDWNGVYNASDMVITGSLSRNEILANHVADSNEVEYGHYRFGCDEGAGNGGGETTDSDMDGVIDSVDQCSGTLEGVDVDAEGCPLDADGDGIPDYLDKCDEIDPVTDVNKDGCEDEEDTVTCSIEAADTGCFSGFASGSSGWVEVTEPADFAALLLLNPLNDVDVNYGSVTINVTPEGDVAVLISDDEGYDLDDYLFEVSDSNDGSADVCKADASVPEPAGDSADAEFVLEGNLSYPIFVRVKANICPE